MCKFEIKCGDITKSDCEAIVNAANNSLQHGGGVCGAIFKSSGAKILQTECDKIGYCKTGGAVITKGYQLKAEYIIHTVGPIYDDGKHGERELLKNCYVNSIKLAIENKIKSIAFPLISSGIFGYPINEAIKVAISAIKKTIKENSIKAELILFDNETYNLAKNIEKYL